MIKISKSEILDYSIITLGGIFYALAVSFFLLPYKLTTGGVSGIGALIYYSTGFEVQNSYLIINALLLVLAVKELGWKFCIKTIFAVLLFTFTLWLGQRVYEMCGKPLLVGEELSMACLIGAILEGAAIGMCFMVGGSTGGTDIIAAIVNKYRNMSLGTVMLLLDVIIISSCYFVFYDIQRVIFGFVLLIISSVTVDYIVSRDRQAVEFKIYSRNPYAIADAIIKTGHGVTIMDGQGYYTKSERKVIVSVVRKREQVIWLRMIKAIDPFAFVTMGKVSGVWGEGFDVMKVRDKDNALKRKVIVLASDDEAFLTHVRSVFGEKYDVRSLQDVGCDTNNPVNNDILGNNAVLKVRYLKNFYGFHSIAYGKTLDEETREVYAVATGNAVNDECIIDKFTTLDEAKAFLDNQK